MTIEDDARKPVQATVPRPLAGLSIDELTGWIGALRVEIVRVEAEIARQQEIRRAADALFRRPSTEA